MTATILIVDDEENALRNLDAFLAPKGFEILTATNLTEARAALQRGEPDIVLLDVQLPDGYGPDLLEESLHYPIRPPIILMTAYGEIEMAVEAMKNGAHDFLQKPIELTRLEQSINRANEIVAMRMELNHLRHSQQANLNFVVGNSPKMRNLVQAMQRASMTSVSILITGETGTGKEVMARAIHLGGPRANKPF
ncbi:MAG: sigma-54-dependent transcriptional regulator, partial [Anaerolineales bacterium]